MLKRIPIDKLVPGMFVNQVVEQSGQLKMRSRGLVRSQQSIEQLAHKGIKIVEIDTDKSQTLAQTDQADKVPTQAAKPASTTKSKASTAEQLTAANDLYVKALAIQSEFFEKLHAGADSDINSVTKLSQNIIDSLFENTDAISCLNLFKGSDAYLLEHSISCAILMGIFARHLNFDRHIIEELSLGAMLMDVGMAGIPSDIYQNTHDLTKSDWQIIQDHVDAGVALLEAFDQISDISLDIVQNHHERMDGSGYPAGKKAADLSTYARMAAIIDSYDAMVSARQHQKRQTPTAVLRTLLSDPALDQTLVQQFIKCIGVHPIGSVVQLKSGKLAIVSSSGKEDPLSPVVMSFYSLRSNTHSPIKRIDLSQSDDLIVASVKPEEFKMNLTKFFRDVFIHQAP